MGLSERERQRTGVDCPKDVVELAHDTSTPENQLLRSTSKWGAANALKITNFRQVLKFLWDFAFLCWDEPQYRKEEDRYSRRVGMAEIEQNDFNLNISRYVSTAEAE